MKTGLEICDLSYKFSSGPWRAACFTASLRRRRRYFEMRSFFEKTVHAMKNRTRGVTPRNTTAKMIVTVYDSSAKEEDDSREVFFYKFYFCGAIEFWERKLSHRNKSDEIRKLSLSDIRKTDLRG